AALWFGRRGTELRRHLSAVSTFRLGRAWLVLINVVALVLIFMFVSKAVTLGSDGYGDYPTWYIVVFGWGTAAFLLAVAAAMSMVRWRRNVSDFAPWPTRPQLDLPPETHAAGASACTPPGNEEKS